MVVQDGYGASAKDKQHPVTITYGKPRYHTPIDPENPTGAPIQEIFEKKKKKLNKKVVREYRSKRPKTRLTGGPSSPLGL